MRPHAMTIHLSLLFLCIGCMQQSQPTGTIGAPPPPSKSKPNPAPAPRPEPAPAPDPEAERPTPSGNEILDAHNEARAKHCAPALKWSPAIAKVAQKWADTLVAKGCAFSHSNNRRYGENLAAGSEGAFTPEQVVDMWYREVDKYDFEDGGFSMDTGHFTQLVWKATRELGCGSAVCNQMRIWVCNYDPPGNVERRYQENVLPTSCRKDK